MSFPVFLGIGGERCGSTWLHTLLGTHPDIYVPVRRKELNYFSQNYSKGLPWYESFFPSIEESQKYDAIGEISPGYLMFEGAEKRISECRDIKKLVLILRNPVNRAYSHYGHAVRLSNYPGTFEEYLTDYPDCFTHGLYAKHLERWLNYFDRSQICCLIFEESVNDLEKTKEKLARFLMVDCEKFPKDAGQSKVNQTYLPRFKFVNYWMARARNKFVSWELDWVINLAKSLGVNELLRAGSKKLPTIPKEMKLKLTEAYLSDIEHLEVMLDLNLEGWKGEKILSSSSVSS